MGLASPSDLKTNVDTIQLSNIVKKDTPTPKIIKEESPSNKDGFSHEAKLQHPFPNIATHKRDLTPNLI